jgi:pimeloyl-ACP methyl ester carboxylesterase
MAAPQSPIVRAALARQWFRQLQAPSKERVVIEDAAHRPLFQEPDQFLRAVEDLIPAAGPPGGGSP